MPLVAKRKVRQTWREAVAARAAAEPGVVRRFEAMLAAGTEESEAAYRALEEAGLLWVADEPGSDRPPPAKPDEVPAA